MAEIIGLMASVGTLSKGIIYTASILRQIHNVPSEVSRALNDLIQLLTELEIVHELQRNITISDDTLAARITKAQMRSLRTAEERMNSFHDKIQRIVMKTNGKFGHMHWVLIGKEQAISAKEDLIQTRAALTSVMTMSIYVMQGLYHNKEMQAMEKLEQFVKDEISSYSLATQPALLPDMKNQMIEESNTESGISYRMSLGPNTYSSTSKNTIDLPVLGRLVCTLTTLAHRTQGSLYGLSLLIPLPFRHVLLANLFLKTNPYGWLNYRIVKDSSLVVLKLVPNDSPFIQACRRGDLNEIRRMLENRNATPYEITPNNETPLSSAVTSGNAHAVELLLNHGASANDLFGRLQTSPLAAAIRLRNVAIIRVLLAHGACCQHVTALGWTPLFYLWSMPSYALAKTSSEEPVNILVNRSDFTLSHSGLVDTAGYGAIHMAAMRGTQAEMRSLMSSGVDVLAEGGPPSWSALRYAVYEGRLDMFEMLWPSFRHISIDATDSQGWTLLHVSALAGHGQMSQRLLELGANQRALTDGRVSFIPKDLRHMQDELQGTRWTPSQLAAQHSPARYKTFMQAVEAFEEENNEAFSEAEEYLCDRKPI